MNDHQWWSSHTNLYETKTIDVLRCISAWNSLPYTVVNSKCVACFENNLKRADLSAFKIMLIAVFFIFRVLLYFN